MGGGGAGRAGMNRGGSFGQMKVGERLLELWSYFQRTPNPVRGPDGGAVLAVCFPRGGGEAGADYGVVGESPGSVVWAQALINCLFRGH